MGRGKPLRRSLIGALVVAAALSAAATARAVAPLCSTATYQASWYVVPCPYVADPESRGCVLKQAFYCANGQPYLDLPAVCAFEWCSPGYCTGCGGVTPCSDSRIGTTEQCGNGFDDDANGCADEGCTVGSPPCSCTTFCQEYACGNVASCDPAEGKREICGNGRDDNCDGRADEDCSPKQCGTTVGVDPIVLTNASAVTEPFSDFAASAVVSLAITRSWNSMDRSFWGERHGPFGQGWSHDWDRALTCAGTICTVANGGEEALTFVGAETVPSLEGLETVQIYRPSGTEGAVRRHLLVKRPGGEWILHAPDGSQLHFATVCDACGEPDEYCAPAEGGGVARLVKKVDPRGNAIDVRYSKVTGLLLGLSDELGHALELRSDTACTDGLARELRYDGARVASYSYDGVLLTGAADADGNTLRGYSYDSGGNGLLLGVLDEAGLPVVEFAYDANWDAIGIVDERTSASITYSEWNHELIRTVTEAYGSGSATSLKRFDPHGNLKSVTGECSCGGATAYGYSGGDRICATDAAGTSTWDDVDALGRTTRHRVYQGTACPPVPTAGLFVVDETTVYGVKKPIAAGVQLELDRVTSTTRTSRVSSTNTTGESWDYDPTPKTYDPVDYSCAETPLPAGAVVCRKVEYGYVRQPGYTAVLERHATFFSYDGRGRLKKTIGPVNLDRPSAVDVVPVEERLYWADGETLARRGRLAETRRYPTPTAGPLLTTYDYDAFGLYRLWEPDGAFTTWIKDGRGRATFIVRSDGTSSETRYHDGDKPRLRISPAGEVTRTSYDNRGRVTAEERLSGDPEVPGASVSILWGEYHQYDLAGNRIHSERRDGGGGAVWARDREFDVAHRLIRERHPELPSVARTWDYRSDGFLTRLTDEEGRATAFAPESNIRIGSVTRSGLDANGAPASLTVARYAYERPSDDLSYVMDGKGNMTWYAHDDFGRLETINHYNFAEGTLKNLWDPRGNLLERRDIYGAYVKATYAYDGLDRIVDMTATNATDGARVRYTYVYDENGAAGHLTRVVEPERTIRFAYDAGGRLDEERQEETGVGAALVTAYVHDSGGRLGELVYPTGLRLAYDRDPVSGEVTALRNATSGEVYASQITRLAGGPLSALSWTNGQTLTQRFNARLEPTSVESGPVSLAYTPTPSGDVGQIVESGLTLPFDHDFLDRLTGSSGWFTYGHDSNGNRSSEWLEGTSLTYAYSVDRVTMASAPGATPTKRYAFAYDFQTSVAGIGRYDQSGAAVKDAVCLRHDPLSRLVKVGVANPAYVAPNATACVTDAYVTAVTARFKYDHRNRRVASWRAETNEWVYTVFDRAGQPLAEVAMTSDPANPWRAVREYVWLDGKPVAQIEHDPVTGAARTYAVHTDAIGMPRALTSPSGAVVWKASVARPYGDISEATTPDPETGKTVVTNLRLPGQYDERLLGSLGLQGPYYNWNRWYLPSVGRYLELDPIAKAGGFNGDWGPEWYGYVAANPLKFIDPTGLSKFDKTFGLPKKFWNWFHRNEKRCGDVDLTKEEAQNLYKEWKDRGSPKPDKKGNWWEDVLDVIVPLPPLLLPENVEDRMSPVQRCQLLGDCAT